MGARTLAAKKAAMEMMMIFGVYISARKPEETKIQASADPMRAPVTRRGRKNPPGTPQP